MKMALYIAGGILLALFLFGLISPAGHGSPRVLQHMRSLIELRGFGLGLIDYAEDHAESFPSSIADLGYRSFERYGFQGNPFLTGTYVRLFAPTDLNPSPLLVQVFSPYSYVVTRDRCHLIVYEKPGLWDEHALAYIDFNLKGRWPWVRKREEYGNTFDGNIDQMINTTWVTEPEFAKYLMNIEPAKAPQSPVDRLVYAAEHGDLDAVRYVAGSSTPIDARDQRGWTALTIAAENGQRKVVDYLISKGSKIDLRDNVGLGRTALMRASAVGYVDIVGDLLAHGADVRVALDDGSTALIDALPHPAIVEKLSAAGADTNQEFRKDWSPLILASCEDDAGAISILIKHGADTGRDDPKALEDASWHGNDEVIDALLSSGVTVSSKALGEDMNFAYDHPAAIKRLIAAGADLNALSTCGGGGTTIMSSAMNACPDAVRILIDAGADINARDDHGYTVLDLTIASSKATELDHTPAEKQALAQIIEMLRKSGAKESGLAVKWPE